MLAVLEQGVFDRLRAIDKDAAKKMVLFPGDPLALAVSPYKDEVGQRTIPRQVAPASLA